jgi:diaminopimelate epimerase
MRREGRGQPFFKMSGSGNDFVFVNALSEPVQWLRSAEAIQRVCDRRAGVGADGVVFLEPVTGHAFRMIYFNNDGSRASFCGNAALCSTSLAMDLGLATPVGFSFRSDAGTIVARIHEDGRPEVDLPPVTDVRSSIALPLKAGEVQAGFAVAGVPHAVILCDDADRVDLEGRGPVLRHHEATNGGANVDFISRASGQGWRMRTFERGVEAETLACGSGAVASAILASTWSGDGFGGETTIVTSSGLPLIVRLRGSPESGLEVSLRGEGRLVFRGELVDY